MTTTRILPCACAHKFQDEEHGKGLRVHNAFVLPAMGKAKGGNLPGWRCTVCRSEKSS